jgi:hypothetical protein
MAAKKSSLEKNNKTQSPKGFTDGVVWLNTNPVKTAKKSSSKK